MLLQQSPCRPHTSRTITTDTSGTDASGTHASRTFTTDASGTSTAIANPSHSIWKDRQENSHCRWIPMR
jgi:hypothetical protein